MNNRARYLFLLILSAIHFTGYSQKIPKILEARAEEHALKTISTLSKQVSEIYTSSGETTFKFDSTAILKSRALFYKHSDRSLTHISPNIMDPSKEFGKSAFLSDTNFLPKNYLIPVSEFFDTLVSWYCNDSCITSVALDIYRTRFDWDDYYYDPQLLCIKVYANFTLYGEPWVPRMNSQLLMESENQQNNAEFDQYFDQTVEFGGEVNTASTMIFLFTLDNENIKNGYIYKIYDDYIDKSVFIDDVRKITSERNKYYLSVKPYLGRSILKADFSDIDNFQQIDDFQPFIGLHVDFNYYFNDGPRQLTKGLSIGAGISRFNATGQVTGYSESFIEYSEPFKQDYTKYVTADNIRENLVLDYLDLNFLFKVRYRIFKNVELMGSIGPQASFLINSKIEPSAGSDGYVTYKGLFTDIEFPNGSSGVFLLEDVPEYGFTTYTDLAFNESEIGINKINFGAYADLGLNFKLSHRLHLAFGISYLHGFGNLVADSSEEDFILSKGNGEVDNIFKNCTSLKINAPSAFISAAYLLNTKIK
jgi:hypothetical protein